MAREPDLFRLTCLTPVHVGSGQELVRDIDFFLDGSNTYVLDTERLIAAGAGLAGLADALVNGRSVIEILRRSRLEPRDFATHVISDRVDAQRIRVALQSGDGRALVPGSSLKGALRTLMLVGWAAASQPHGTRTPAFDQALRAALAQPRPKSGALDDAMFRAPALREPKGDILRTLKVSDALFDPGQLTLVSSKAVGTTRVTLTGTESLRPGATAVVRLTVDRTELIRHLGFPADVPSWSELAGWSRAHARHLLVEDQRYFADQGCEGPRACCQRLLAEIAALPPAAAVLRLAWGTGWRTMTGDLLTPAERSQLRIRLGKTRKVTLAGHQRNAAPDTVFGWIRLDPVSETEAANLYVAPVVSTPVQVAPPPDRTTLAGPREGRDVPTPAEDPFQMRLRAFHDREFGQLRQLISQIEARPDRDAAFRVLGARLAELYGRDKRRFKRIRDEYPQLTPYLGSA